MRSSLHGSIMGAGGDYNSFYSSFVCMCIIQLQLLCVGIFGCGCVDDRNFVCASQERVFAFTSTAVVVRLQLSCVVEKKSSSFPPLSSKLPSQFLFTSPTVLLSPLPNACAHRFHSSHTNTYRTSLVESPE